MMQWQIDYQKHKEERKAYLNRMYPNNKIQGIDIAHLRKVGYLVGLGSTKTKKEFIDSIISMQNTNNPIIGIDYKGNYMFNKDVKLIDYL